MSTSEVELSSACSPLSCSISSHCESLPLVSAAEPRREAQRVKRVKRHNSIGEAPQVVKQFTIAGVTVPLEKVDVGGDDMATVVPLSGKSGRWISKALGWRLLPFSGQSLFREIHDAISATRGNRLNRRWKGSACFPTLKLVIRDKEIEVINNLTTLCLVIEDSDGEPLNWVMQQLHAESHGNDDE